MDQAAIRIRIATVCSWGLFDCSPPLFDDSVSASLHCMSIPNVTSKLSSASSSETSPRKVLVAASGTGGHLFPALAIADQLSQENYSVEWLGVKNRLETQLVPQRYPLQIIPIEGFQNKDLRAVLVLFKFLISIWKTRQILKKGQFQGVVTTGGYIAAPAIIAARTLGLPSILHEANAIPGKVTRGLSQWCTVVALGFEAARQYLPKAQSIQVVGTPVRESFLGNQSLDLPIPSQTPLIVVAGGSQGAVALNRHVRTCARAWLETGAWIVHLTGDRDPEVNQFQHPRYISLKFFDNMAGLFQRADIAVSRAGAGTLTELAITGTPAVLIPYPYAAEDHQSFNAQVYVNGDAGVLFQEKELDSDLLKTVVLDWLNDREKLKQLSDNALALAVPNSTEKVVAIVNQYCVEESNA